MGISLPTSGLRLASPSRSRFVILSNGNLHYFWDDYARVPNKYRVLIPEYIKDYVSLNQFAA